MSRISALKSATKNQTLNNNKRYTVLTQYLLPQLGELGNTGATVYTSVQGTIGPSLVVGLLKETQFELVN